MFFSRFAVLCTLPFLALGAKKRAEPSMFSLFGYGAGSLGGLPLFYANGYAYIGTPSLFDAKDAAPVIFSLGTDDRWLGSPNTTMLTNAAAASWTNVTFYVPDDSASDRRVGFRSSNNHTGGATETGFSFYGATALLIGESGTIESSFSALQINPHVYQLFWNDTNPGQVPVVLRNVAPSNPSN